MSIAQLMSIIGVSLFLVASPPGNIQFYESDNWQVPNHRLVETTRNPDGSQLYKVLYEGYERGSRRVVNITRLTRPSDAAALSFEVKFCEGFDFTLGGKLHGLGSLRPTTGSGIPPNDSWSARIMWRDHGRIRSYVYHQDMQGPFGEHIYHPSFRFQPGQFHSMNLQVILNSAADKADGKVIISADGEQLIKHESLRFRTSDSANGLIHTFLFNTFHGGSNEDWAPRNEDGAFKTDCAYFRNFQVVQSVRE